MFGLYIFLLLFIKSTWASGCYNVAQTSPQVLSGWMTEKPCNQDLTFTPVALGSVNITHHAITCLPPSS